METFSATRQESLLNLAAQTINYRSSLIDLFIKNSTELDVSAITVPDPELKKSNAFIGIWKGTGKIESKDELAGKTYLTYKGDGTANSNYGLSLEKPGLDLLTDPFTIGLFLNNDDPRSLAASVNLIQGKTNKYQSSTISVTDANNRFLTVFYNVPDTVNPYANVDELYLYKGESLPTVRSSYVKNMYLKEEDYTGIVKMPVDDILLRAGMYLLAYNPGMNPNPFSCACSFKIV
jgi:hypothetical protein